METHALKRHVGEDGILRIEIPVGVYNVDVEVVIVVQLEAKKSKSSKHERANESWSDEEEQRVLKMYQSGAPIVAIAGKLKRSHGAIRSRLRKLGIDPDGQ